MRLIDAVPGRCADLLAAGEVEAALVPVIEYQRIDGLLADPDVCVASRYEVLSVVLASQKEDLRQVRTVALDQSSRTSTALIKIIFREFLGFEPRWAPLAPDLKRMLSENDAALIIGDPGMTFERGGLHVYDMASLWRKYTNQGFVFAMWAIRNDASQHTRNLSFSAAAAEGIKAFSEIAEAYHAQLDLPMEYLLSYLRDNITYRMDDELRAGLLLYYQLAQKHGLIPEVKPLVYIV